MSGFLSHYSLPWTSNFFPPCLPQLRIKRILLVKSLRLDTFSWAFGALKPFKTISAKIISPSMSSNKKSILSPEIMFLSVRQTGEMLVLKSDQEDRKNKFPADTFSYFPSMLWSFSEARIKIRSMIVPIRQRRLRASDGEDLTKRAPFPLGFLIPTILMTGERRLKMFQYPTGIRINSQSCRINPSSLLIHAYVSELPTRLVFFAKYLERATNWN